MPGATRYGGFVTGIRAASAPPPPPSRFGVGRVRSTGVCAGVPRGTAHVARGTATHEAWRASSPDCRSADRPLPQRLPRPAGRRPVLPFCAGPHSFALSPCSFPVLPLTLPLPPWSRPPRAGAVRRGRSRGALEGRRRGALEVPGSGGGRVGAAASRSPSPPLASPARLPRVGGDADAAGQQR